MPTTPLFRRALAPALVALALAGAAQAAAPPEAPERPGPNTAAAAATGEPRTLDEAVASGLVDEAVVRTLRARGEVDALVTFADRTANMRVPAARLREHVAGLRSVYAKQEREAVAAADGDADVIRTYPNLPVSFVRFDSEQALLDVALSDGVTGVRENERGSAATQQSLNLIGQPTVAAAGRTGGGTYVAVLDTGVEYSRSAFGSCSAPGGACRVALAYEFGDRDGLQDDHVSKHGTNVAGIVAGVAPGTKIIAMDVFTNGSYWTSDAITQAVDQLVSLKAAGWNVRAMNLSLGTSNNYHETACSTHPLGPAFAKARQAGILPIVSSGNNAYRNGAYVRGIGAPACVPGSLSVGATSDSAHGGISGVCDAASAADRVMYFSQSGSLLSMLAPGNCITAAGISMQGTSQAAPHVAGAAAVLAAAKPSATVDQITSALVNTGPAISDTRFNVTRRRLDLPAAVNALVGSTSGDTTPPTVTAPLEQIDVPNKVTATTVPVKLTWSASDASGIAAYELWVSTNGGSYVRDTSVTTQATKTYALTVGSRYQFAVRAKDGAGNWSGYAYSQASTVGLTDERTAFPTLGGGWTRYSWTSALGGTAITSSTAGDWVQFSFTGRSVALVAPKFANAGRAYVYCDGTYYGLVDLYASTTTGMNTVFSCRFAQSTTHTMKVVLEGTSGRPRFDVDAFAFLG